MKSIRLAQAGIVLIPIVLFGWLAWQELVPSGTFTFAREAGVPSPFIDRLLPDGRVTLASEAGSDAVDTITGDPSFFFVHPHRAFDAGEVEVRFKNAGVPIVELGGLAREDGQVYDLTPVQNLLIDQSTWPKLAEQGIVLLQREKTFATIADFLADPPPRDEIATYHYSLTRPYRLPRYVPLAGTRHIDLSLRGFHEAKTYVKDEPISFTVSFTDENRAEGPDPFEIIAFDETGKPVASVRADDDGNVRTDARPSSVRSLTLEVPSAAEGVYKLEFRAGTDIILRGIDTVQSKLVFLNTLILGDEVGYRAMPSSVRVWTEAKSLAFETTHAEGVQDVDVGGDRVSIATPFARVAHTVAQAGVVRITVPKGDARVFGNGHYAFAPEQFFNPDPVRLTPDINLDQLNVKYIIAAYTPPERDGEWFVARVPFDTRVLAQIDGVWKFAFSVPGIERRGGHLFVHSIVFTLHRAPFTFDQLVEALRRRL